MATMKDIARQANISPSTVSRVLSGDKTFSVSDEVRSRIIHIARELNYHIKGRRVQNSMVLVPSGIGIVQFWEGQGPYWDQFFISIRTGIDKECKRMGIESFLRIYYPDKAYAGLGELDGVIVIGENPSFGKDLYRDVKNIVFVDQPADEPGFDCVTLDYATATADALEYLFKLGHSKIGFMGGSMRTNRSEDRGITFEKLMSERGRFNIDDVYVQGWTMDDGYAMMSSAIKKGNLPTAFFMASDLLAIGAYKALSEAGIDVPGDISIVGFDDLPMANFLIPALTTVKVHAEAIGQMAVRVLLDRLDGREVPITVSLATELVIRDSCAPPAMA